MPTTSWTSNASASWRDAFGGWRSDNNDVYQGEWSGNGNHRGLWFFNDSNIRSVLDGQIITNIRMRATRRSAGGVTSAQTPTIYRHNYSSQPAGTPSGSAGHSNHGQSWAWGETKWVTLPIAYGNHLRDGTARGILVYTSSGSPYMIFTGTAILEITYEPALSAPSTPSGFSVGSVTTSSAVLSWNSVSDADQYRYTNQQLNPTGSTNEFTTSGTSITNSSGISSNRRYRWRVRAENSAGVSSYTSYVERTTLPTTPGGVGASPASGTTGETAIVISWNAIAGTETQQYRVDRSGGGTSTTSGTSLSWGGLSPDTTYSFRVRAENTAGNSSYSGWTSAKTKLPSPSTPNQPSASNLAETSVTISWNAVSYAENYDLEHNGSIIRSATASRSHNITGIADGATHSFRVRARNATATSSYSSARTVETPPIHEPPPVPSGVGPTGLLTPADGLDLSATTGGMDPDKNAGLSQRVRWEVTLVRPFPNSEVFELVTPYGGVGERTRPFDIDADLGGVGHYRVRARSEHNGVWNQASGWSDFVEFSVTRVLIWDGSEWQPRHVLTFSDKISVWSDTWSDAWQYEEGWAEARLNTL